MTPGATAEVFALRVCLQRHCWSHGLICNLDLTSAPFKSLQGVAIVVRATRASRRLGPRETQQTTHVLTISELITQHKSALPHTPSHIPLSPPNVRPNTA
eukprot:263723-Prymnesium_polylepis.1